MSDEPTIEARATGAAPDPVLEALAEYLGVLRALQADMAALASRLDRIEAALTPPKPEPEPALPSQCTELDVYLAGVVRTIYRDQGHKPVSTKAVAYHTTFVEGYVVRLLADAAEHGAIYAVPGRGKRRSGKWLPFAPSLSDKSQF